MRQRSPLLLVLCLLLSTSTMAQTTRVLFLGNSYVYTNDMPTALRQLALSLGDTIVTAQSTPGGYTFQGHTTLAASQQLIDQGNWDFVVLQEQSQIPSFPLSQVQSDCFPYAAQLVDSIRVHSPCAEPVFFMTWGRQNGDAQNCASWPPVCTFEGMNGLLRERYLTMAVDNSAWCAPVGMAWKHTRDQQPAVNLYSADGSHPAAAGTYLAACTFYATLYRTSPVGASYTAGLDPTTAATLQALAASTVLDSLGTWNIGVNDPDAAFTTSSNGAAVNFTPNNGAGAHTWLFGDGATDNSTVTTHTYAQSGMYDVMHIVQDACGRMDTAIVPVNVVISSMPEPALPETPIGSMRPVVAQDRIWFTPDRGGRFEAWSLTGQLLMGAELAGSQTYQRALDLPANTMLLWRFSGADGVIDSGRLLVP
jgi:PKD repeat protein